MVIWEDPPAPPHRWNDLLDECRLRPGDWAKHGPYSEAKVAYQTAKDLKRGARGNAQVGEFEIIARKGTDGTGWYVYLRCVAWPELRAVES